MAAPLQGILGNGKYRVQIQHRPRINSDGSISIGTVGELTTTRIFWSRLLDDTSEASCDVPVTGVAGETCCDILQNVIPIADELVIFRNDVPVWVGPILSITYADDKVSIEANDLSWWLNHRVPRVARTYNQQDLSTIFKQLVQDALDIEYFGMLYDINPSGITGDRTITLNEYTYFGDTLRELGNTGIDWTVHLRKMFAGGYTVPNATPIAALKSEHFQNGYEIALRGDIMCTDAIVKGDSEGSTAQYGFDDAQFGVVDSVWEENDIKDYNSALQAAKTRWEMLKKPVLFFRNPTKVNTGLSAEDLSATGTGILVPNAPVVIEGLIPGATVGLNVNYLCQDVEFLMRLKRISVTVENNENVELGLIPVGTSNQDED